MKCTCGADNWISRYETNEDGEKEWVESECQNCFRYVN
jgi:hypothetical protein